VLREQIGVPSAPKPFNLDGLLAMVADTMAEVL
jgi:hypothetical protein